MRYLHDTVSRIWGILIVMTLLLLSSCSGTRHLPEGAYLYTGSSISYLKSSSKEPEKAEKAEVKAMLLPNPNSKILGMRPRLALYNMIRDSLPKQKGFRNWLKWKIGEVPILLSDVNRPDVEKLISNKLFNLGYFHSNVNSKVKTGKNKANIKYRIEVSEPWVIQNLVYPPDSSGIYRDIAGLRSRSVLKKGDNFNLEKIKEERLRIDNGLKSKGYYFFSPNFILFQTDSTREKYELDMTLSLKKEADPADLAKFRIGDINLWFREPYSEATPESDSMIILDGIRCMVDKDLFRLPVITRKISIRKGALYNSTEHSKSIRQLMGLGVFQYVTIRYSRSAEHPDSLLNVMIIALPKKKYALRAEVNAAFKSNNFVGPGVAFSLRNRNLFKGAEELSLSAKGRVEAQIGNQGRSNFNYEAGLEANLLIPRFMPSVFLKNETLQSAATSIGLGFNFFNRVNFYSEASANLGFNYLWKNNLKLDHQLRLISINYIKLLSLTQEFEDYLDANPFVKRSFDEQFIFGCGYSVLYSTFANSRKSSKYSLRLDVDLSGNFLYAMYSAFSSQTLSPETPYSLLGNPFSQFARFRGEAVYQYSFNEKNSIIGRTIAGIGIPYGNSGVLPFAQQFFVGGTNSLRAFPARSVGPGTYKPADPDGGNSFIDQKGDIGLEFNVEYRLAMSKIFKLGIFLDAGNIWLYNDDALRPGAVFRFDSFWRQLALGTGLGLRIDFNIFLLRFDMGLPIRDPGVSDNNGWVIRDQDWRSKAWRRDNLILNIAIGYPF